MIKEKIPALLASRDGLAVACGMFNVLDAKDRKIALKTLPVNEMVGNKVAHLYLIHYLTCFYLNYEQTTLMMQTKLTTLETLEQKMTLVLDPKKLMI